MLNGEAMGLSKSTVRHTLRLMLLSLCLFLSAQAQANEQLIRQVLEPKLKGSKIEGIQPAPMAGLFEVRFRSATSRRLGALIYMLRRIRLSK